ncbi:hypothetical protein CF319_g8918, partial [Tilletia indica]
MIDLLHIFSLQRQSKVHTAHGGQPNAARDFEHSKLEVRFRNGGMFSQHVHALSSQTIALPGHFDGGHGHSKMAGFLKHAPMVSTGSESDDEDEDSGDGNRIALTPAQQTHLDTVNELLRNPLLYGRRWNELGSILGSVSLLPIMMLAKSLKTSLKLRKFKAPKWQYLIALLRGLRPVAAEGQLPFTAADQQIVDAITFAARGVLPCVLWQALAVADGLDRHSTDGTYCDVLLMRPASVHPSLGTEEPSSVRTHVSSASLTAQFV